MAITTRSTAGIKYYFGLSGDTKPTTNTPIGSEFFESDTGLTFKWSGTEWASTTVTEIIATAVLSALASLATSQQALAANTNRAGVIMVNTDANIVRIKYGTTASASSFTVPIGPGAVWEMPIPIYSGRIDAIWDADGAGSLFITEW